MVATPKLAQLADLADVHRWRVVLVGDPLQFSPVGRGGMFGWLVEAGPHIELDQVHRFTEPWEAEASLQLRAGDTDALDVYDAHGRLHSATPDQIDNTVLNSGAVTARPASGSPCWRAATTASHASTTPPSNGA